MSTARTMVVCAMVACVMPITARMAAGGDGALGMPVGAPNPGPVRIGDPFTAAAVRWALDGAARRLERPLCQEVLTDFSDADGRSLQQNLQALGESGGSYMEEKMLFYEGKSAGRCRHTGVLAYTSPGSRVVYVCGRAFQAAWRGQPRVAEAIMIHETLHSLGLREDPPSSEAITAGVLKKCGH